jgi:glycosyltransferase involved in cell wall biosynthesis
MVTISVIVPYYNNGATVKETLESIVGQSYKPSEIIVVNDGSSPKEARVLNKIIIDLDADIVVYSQRNQGVSVARNVGIEKSMSDYVAFLDSDDVWNPNYLKVASLALSDPTVDCFVGSVEKVFQSGRTRVYGPRVDVLLDGISAMKEVLVAGKITSLVQNKIVRREIARNNPFPLNIAINEDVATVYRWFKESEKVFLSNEILIRYIQREKSAINTMNTSKVDSVLRAAELIHDDIFDTGYKDEYYVYYMLHVEMSLRQRLSRTNWSKEDLDSRVKRYGIEKLLKSAAKHKLLKALSLMFYRAF